MRYLPVANDDQLTEGKGVPVEIEGRAVVLFRSGKTVYALDNSCPHIGARIEHGRVTRDIVTCPLHGARFELPTGRCLNPHVGGWRPIVTHGVRIVDGRIEVALADRPVTAPFP